MEEEVLISLTDMDFFENEDVGNSHAVIGHSHHTGVKASLHWLDLRVFYVRVCKCAIDANSMPESLMLNHVPLTRDTLLEVNCVRASIYSDGVSTLLKRDRLDKRSEEVTFVNTDSIRVTGSVMFEVFHENVLVLSGTLEFPSDKESKYQSWSMNCESDIPAGTGFFKGNPNLYNGVESIGSPIMEVYVAGSFLGSPIVLNRTLQMSCHRRKQSRKGIVLESIPEYETTKNHKGQSSTIASTMALAQLRQYNKPPEEGHCRQDSSIVEESLENEDGELSWFNAGVRVGVGIGLSICLGVGIGVGLLVRTYHGTTWSFKRRLL